MPKINEAPKKAKYSAPAIGRAFELIELIAANKSAKFTEIVLKLGIPKSSAHVILTNLEDLGYIYRDSEANYRLTVKLKNLMVTSTDGQDTNEIVKIVAKKHLMKLKDETGLSVHLAKRDGVNVLYLEKIESDNFIRFDTYIGKRAPLHLTAVGKALLAAMTKEDVSQLSESFDFEAGNKATLKNLHELSLQLDSFRKMGYAIEDQEEAAGVRCIASHIPGVFDNNFSIGVIGMTDQISDKDYPKIAAKIVKIAQLIVDEVKI
jgi:DNA-binding IclR family transcriptional regulator